MDKMWQLVKSSVIVQGAVTFIVVGTSCYLWATGRVVPQELLAFDGVVLGFFFGAKVQNQIGK